MSAESEGRGPGQGLSRGQRWQRIAALLVLLSVFLLAVDLLGDGIAALGEDFTDALFRGLGNPVLGLCVGILATVLAQSSSVTTATVVGLVGAGVIALPDAVPVIMGANVGTTITNTLASLGSIRRPEEFRRAFAGATVHDVFNLLAVAVLLPIELATGILARIAVWLSGPLADATTGELRSPVKAVIDAAGGTVVSAVEAVVGDGQASGVVLIVLGLGAIFATLFAITRTMRAVMAGPAERVLNDVLGRIGVIGILAGVLLTVAVQSSSITTSLLIPMLAAGVLSLRSAYPVTLGANLGTTITALLAALAVDLVAGLQIALVHLLFNVVGILALYGVPLLRGVPVVLAERIADIAVRRRVQVVVYVVILFYVAPLLGIILLR
ncbi:MAG: Na/Pi symporter [Egibacteraceae bacterium]